MKCHHYEECGNEAVYELETVDHEIIHVCEDCDEDYGVCNICGLAELEREMYYLSEWDERKTCYYCEMKIKKGVWECIDDSSSQYVRKNNGYENAYDLIEMSLINPGTNTYEVYEDTIDIDDYMENEDGKTELDSILNGFGYDGVEDVKTQYGEAAYQVMAECIFEHYGNFQASQIFTGSENECREFIENYILK